MLSPSKVDALSSRRALVLLPWAAPLPPRARLFSLVLSLLTAAFMGLGGCEPYSLGEGPNRFPAPPDADPLPCEGDSCPDGGSGGGGCDCLQIGDWYRFDGLTLDSLDGNPSHPARGILNNLWAVDIRTLQLNVLFEITEINGEGSVREVTIRAMNAAYNGDTVETICLLPSTEISFTLAVDGCSFSPISSGGINIYAGSQEIPKNCGPDVVVPHTIPVRNVALGGIFEAGCGRILEGKAPGASLGQLEIGGICTCLASNPEGLERCEGPASDYQDPAGLCNGCGERYSNLGEQLETLNGGRPLELGCEVDEGDGPRPAICLDASFSAERLNFSPMNCPGL